MEPLQLYEEYSKKWRATHRGGSIFALLRDWKIYSESREESGCDGVLTGPELITTFDNTFLRTLQDPSITRLLSVRFAASRDNAKTAIIITCTKVSGEMGQNPDIRVSRYMTKIIRREGTYEIHIDTDGQILALTDANVVVRTWLRPFFTAKGVIVNQALSLACYKTRDNCAQNDALTRLRTEMLDYIANLLNTNPEEWLRSNAEMLLRSEIRAQLMTYLWIRLAYEPMGGQRDIIDVRKHLQEIYTSQLRGIL